ncbi:MAG: hypothetical protein Q7S92_04585 [Candidatus Diapherotrites archaeon]|nr:hypothetical protein [Candidatus Diapherotrites archaeon]
MAEVQSKKLKATVDKWKKKRWYTVLAPASFDRQLLGETPAAKPNLLENRTIEITLDKVTGDRKQRHITTTFQVVRVEGSNAHTELQGHEIKQSYLSRLIRRRKSKVDTVCTALTRDKKQVRVKALCLANLVPKKEESELRRIMDDELMGSAKRRDADQYIQELIFGTIAARIFKRAKNVAIIKRIEIVKSRILNTSKEKKEFVIEGAAPVKPETNTQPAKPEAKVEPEVSNAGNTTQ